MQYRNPESGSDAIPSEPQHLLRLYQEFSYQLTWYFNQHFLDDSEEGCSELDCDWPQCETSGNCERLNSILVDYKEVDERHPLNNAATALAQGLGRKSLPSSDQFDPGGNFRKILFASGALSMGLARKQGFEQELLADPDRAVREAVRNIKAWIESKIQTLRIEFPHVVVTAKVVGPTGGQDSKTKVIENLSHKINVCNSKKNASWRELEKLVEVSERTIRRWAAEIGFDFKTYEFESPSAEVVQFLEKNEKSDGKTKD